MHSTTVEKRKKNVFVCFCFQLYTLNINNQTDCLIKFMSNQRVGLLLFGGIVVGTLFK